MTKPRNIRLKRLLLLSSVAASGTACLVLGSAALPSALLMLGRILLQVATISFVTALLEFRGLLAKLGRFLAPLTRFARLPADAAAGLTAALASTAATGLLLARAREEGRITRREMILAAVGGAPVTLLVVNLTNAFPIIALIGKAGLIYYLISWTVLFVMLFLVLGYARLTAPATARGAEAPAPVPEPKRWPIAIRQAGFRTGQFLGRTLFLTVPFFLWTSVAVRYGVFDFAEHLPEPVQRTLPPEAWSVFAARFGGMLSAAGVAVELLRKELLTTSQLVLVLLLGNVVNGFVRIIRRGMPVSLGIYPGRDGAIISATSMLLRATLTLAAIVIFWGCTR